MAVPTSGGEQYVPSATEEIFRQIRSTLPDPEAVLDEAAIADAAKKFYAALRASVFNGPSLPFREEIELLLTEAGKIKIAKMHDVAGRILALSGESQAHMRALLDIVRASLTRAYA